MVTNEDILDGVVEGVPDMQVAGYVGWRDDDRIGFGDRIRVARKSASRLPAMVLARTAAASG